VKTSAPALRRSLLLYLLIPLIALWIFSGLVAYRVASNYANIAFDRSLFDSVETIEEQIKIKDGRATLELPDAAWQVLGFDQQDEVFFDVRRGDGSVLAGEIDIPDPSPQQYVVGKAILHDGMMHGKRVRIASMYANPGGQSTGKAGEVLVQVAETLNKRTTMAEEMLWSVAVPELILVFLAWVSVWIGVSRSLKPLERLRDAVSNRSHRDLSPIQEDHSPREVQPLLSAINDLMQRLNLVLNMQRHFIADAAHQLRTPLAGLTTQTELALRQTDPKALKHALGQIHAGVERANHLVHQLLSLARAETGPDLIMNFEPLDLNELARLQTAEWVPRAVAKGIDLGYDGPEQPVRIIGQALLLREMLVNILDNAIRYTPQNGKATVHLVGGEHPLLTVEDNGPGIPLVERDRVFERFHRLITNGESGSGLGLPIVREIARAHHARVWLADADAPGGLRVHIQFENASVS
jgi:two-component system, OmpR family, sensor histidine kinase TctE